MSKIDRFDRDNLRTLRADLDAALNTVAQKYGINLALGTGRFDPESVTWKLTGNVVRSANVKTKEALDFERYAASWGLEKSDLGAEFTQGRKRFQITGAKPSSHKYPILAKEQRSGKTYKFSPVLVKMYLGKKPSGPAVDEQYVVVEDEGRYFVLDTTSNRRLRGPERDGAFKDEEDAQDHADMLSMGTHPASVPPGFNNRHED